MIDSITDRFYLLATHPNIGRARDRELQPGLRTFPAGDFVIIYRIEDDDVLILRVLRCAANTYGESAIMRHNEYFVFRRIADICKSPGWGMAPFSSAFRRARPS